VTRKGDQPDPFPLRITHYAIGHRLG